MYYVYIIQSLKDNSWYYGFSENPQRRLLFHNQGSSRYTKTKMPWKLIFLKNFDIKTEALKFERYLKKTKNKKFISSAYAEFFIRDVAQSG
ncbi:MAG: GIY-YIG nuclease family protein [Cyclobacteriaceae bacterium]|nr:GIY-YIG nuclease family protein [Cyclobacteriaceae bacterium]